MGGENCKLIEASRSGSVQRAAKAIRKGAEIDEPDAEGKTALHYASKFGHVDVVNLLIEKRATVDVRSLGNGETPLHKACKENKLEACRALIEAGASVTVKPRSGNVLAMRKCAKDYPRVASLIRELQGSPVTSSSTSSASEPSSEGGTVPVRAAPEGYVSPKLLQRQSQGPQEQDVEVAHPNSPDAPSPAVHETPGVISMGNADVDIGHPNTPSR